MVISSGTAASARARRAGWLLVCAGVLAFAALVAAGNWSRSASLRSTWPLDLGAFHNQALNQARGRDVTYIFITSWFKTGDFEGPSVYRSNHFSPLRLFVLPQVYRLWPRIETLMVLQGLLIGVGALALYGFALDRAGSAALGGILAGSYLLHPAVLHLAMNDYRDIAMGLGPALVALWLHARGKTAGFVVAALLMLAARPDYVPLLALFGLLTLRQRAPGTRSARDAALPLALAAGWGLVCEGYYRFFYGVSWPLLSFATGQPLSTAALELAQRLLPFLELMLAPALLALGSPEVAAAALPFIALARRVHPLEFPPHHLQHLAPAMAAVFWAYAASVARWWPGLGRGARRAAGSALVLAAVLSGAYFVQAALHAYPPQQVGRYRHVTRFSDQLPVDATAVVPDELLALFSGHTRLLTYEHLPLDPERAVDARAALVEVLRCADLVVTRREPDLDEAVAATGSFAVAGNFPRFRVYLRRSDVPRPEPADLALQRALRWCELSGVKRRGASLCTALPRGPDALPSPAPSSP